VVVREARRLTAVEDQPSGVEAVLELLAGAAGELRRQPHVVPHEATKLLESLCLALTEVAEAVGLHDEAAWRLLALRDELDSYLFAAGCMSSLDVPADRVVRLLERGLDMATARVAAELA
jgi:hypothetical protein